MFDRAFWEANCHKSGEQIARETGKDSGNVRRAIREAKETYDLDWYSDSRQKAPQRGVAVYDLHHPQHDKKLWRNILAFAQAFKPDVWVFGGDNMHVEALSHWEHDKGNKRILEGKRLKREYEELQRDALDPVDRIMGDGRKVFLIGNHEDWIEQYIDKHPEVEGFFELRNNLRLDSWEVYDLGLAAEVGKLNFIHGDYANKHSACKTVETYNRNMVYGHGHTYQAFTTVAPLDSQAHCAIQLPCACVTNPEYAWNKPNRWVSGFGVFYVRPDGTFNVFPVIAVDGCFTAPDGTYYG